MESSTSSFGETKCDDGVGTKRKTFVYSIGLFSDGKVRISYNDTFACAEQNLVKIALKLNKTLEEVYVYRVIYEPITPSRSSTRRRRTRQRYKVKCIVVDPCCFCKALISNLPTTSFSFWGRGRFWTSEPTLPSEICPWVRGDPEKYYNKRRFVVGLIDDLGKNF